MQPNEIVELKDQALAEANAADSAEALEAVRVAYLGSKGKLKSVMKGLSGMDPADRPIAGQKANELKTELSACIEARLGEFAGASGATPADAIDITLPGQWTPAGALHPVRQITDRVVDIFRRIGFTVATGPDIDTVRNNFDALNTPDDHPSRSEIDTFYLDDVVEDRNGVICHAPGSLLLRTQTSPVQIRYMESHTPPIRIVAPGRCYRRDTADATHTANFHQIEGLYISEHVSLADLKGDLSYFAQSMLGEDAKVRFRPHFFPFTEPSVEVDFYAEQFGGWVEIGGAGMVDPEVLKAVGYDPDKVTGYAFGMGLERIAAILYKLDDIRKLYENDRRFLSQFS